MGWQLGQMLSQDRGFILEWKTIILLLFIM